MNPFLIIAIALSVLCLVLIIILIRKNKDLVALKAKLNDTKLMIDQRLELADKYSRILASVADKTFEAVIITDKDGKIEWVNAGFTTITGYTFMEVKGKKPGEILQGPLTDRTTISRIREKLKEKKIFKEEILNYHKRGHTYWLSLSITPILDINNNIERFIAIESDITEQKKEMELLESKLKQIGKH